MDNALKAMAARNRALLNNTSKRKRDQVVTLAALNQDQLRVLEITDHNGTPLHQLPTYQDGCLHTVVGERMRLRVRTNPSHARVTGVRWTVSQHTVRRCTQTPGQGTADPLTDTDLDSTDLDFYWVTGGQQSVQVSADVDGRQVTALATVEVLAPQVGHCRLTTSAVSVCADDEYLRPGPWMALYEPAPERYGCTWSAELTMPFKQIGNRLLGAGQAAFIQVSGFAIANFDYDNDDLNYANVTTTVTYGPGPVALDADAASVTYGSPKPAPAGVVVTFGPNDITYSDSPACMLEDNLRHITRNDVHRLHLVYRSGTPDSIWVTLCRGEWTWEAQLTRTDLATRGSPWAAPQATVHPPPHQQTDLPASHEPPTWLTRTDTIVAAGPQRLPV